MESKKVLFAWNPRDSCFALERPCFGGVDLQRWRSLGPITPLVGMKKTQLAIENMFGHL